MSDISIATIDVDSSFVDVQLELQLAGARENFWAFRLWMHPDLLKSWWQYDVASHLQIFYDDFLLGKRPKIILEAPPQHGKTIQVEDFITWCAGKNPNLKEIFASFSDDLGSHVNRSIQRILDDPRYKMVFANTQISDTNVTTQVGRWMRNSSLIEFIGHNGSFRNTTVNGQINGLGLDLGFIDDPIKGRAEASSKVNRDKAWSWLTDDFFGRFSDAAGMLMIMTRWHVDDPVGRWMLSFPETKLLQYPAVAVNDSKEYRRSLADKENRRIGEALFPNHKSLEFLMERKKLLTEAGWQSVYQQNPIVVGGGIFPIEKLITLNLFDRTKIICTVRYWDKAGTEDGGAYTSGVLMHALTDGTFVIEHVVRGQWSALEREEKIRHWSSVDRKTCHNYQVIVEQEPGSGGKESAEGTVRMLAGYRAYADKVTGSKEIRAEPFAAQVQGGNVRLIAGDWQYSFLDEAESFPNGKYKDQIDAASGAFAKLASGTMYNLDAMAS
jgi:predicted phage terminase large subunit-like protein